jgi:hypothetical protein
MILEHITYLIEELEDRLTDFILHKHVADRAGLHYDLRIKRLDRNTVISFAIPNADIPTGIKKSLLVTNFEHGPEWTKIKTLKIEKGYGKGDISTIQQGSMEIHEWDFKTNKINFTVSNSKGPLKGTYYIIPAKFKDSKPEVRKNQYLLFRAKTQK